MVIFVQPTNETKSKVNICCLSDFEIDDMQFQHRFSTFCTRNDASVVINIFYEYMCEQLHEMHAHAHAHCVRGGGRGGDDSDSGTV